MADVRGRKDAWLIFYHDAIYRAVKWGEDGEVAASVKREKNKRIDDLPV